ncbi:MAG: hypothetical protein M3445_07405 [Actinomycetota bacterium]|nr:hypothetical protein [Actinomycetota bacterium]
MRAEGLHCEFVDGLAELMALGGYSTNQAAMRYQQAASDRLAELARKRAEARGWAAELGEQ